MDTVRVHHRTIVYSSVPHTHSSGNSSSAIEVCLGFCRPRVPANDNRWRTDIQRERYQHGMIEYMRRRHMHIHIHCGGALSTIFIYVATMNHYRTRYWPNCAQLSSICQLERSTNINANTKTYPSSEPTRRKEIDFWMMLNLLLWCSLFVWARARTSRNCSVIDCSLLSRHFNHLTVRAQILTVFCNCFEHPNPSGFYAIGKSICLLCECVMPRILT